HRLCLRAFVLGPMGRRSIVGRSRFGDQSWGSAPEELLVEDDAPALAFGAFPRQRFEKALADAFAGHLDQAQFGYVEHLRAGLVAGQSLAECRDDLVTVGLLLHVDEVDDDDAADVTQ